jgi:ClpP class serine protease
VKNTRGSKLDMKVDGLLNGRMFYAANGKDNKMDAKSVGLIDEVGNMDRAIMLAQGLAEVRKLLSNQL